MAKQHRFAVPAVAMTVVKGSSPQVNGQEIQRELTQANSLVKAKLLVSVAADPSSRQLQWANSSQPLLEPQH
jgi:hypothetical protein